jgi:4'-phosphopantetheinyl transferase
VDPVTVWLARAPAAPRQVARTLLVRAVAALLRVAPDAVVVDREAGGRPVVRCAGATAPHVSVSHCRGLVAVAVSTLAPLGVDAERIRPLPARQLARRWLPPGEHDWVAGTPQRHQAEAFLLLWTAKEAIGKAYGVGLRGAGTHRPVPPPEGWPPPERLCLRPVPDDPGLALAMASHAGTVLALACLHPDAARAPVTVQHV